MKAYLLILFSLLIGPALLADSPWSDYATTPPPANSPADLVFTYVTMANESNFDACRQFMTPDYEAWLERVGGIESCLDVFVQADLQRRFAWRQSIDNNSATVWVRIHVNNRGREVNVALNLVQSASGWKLTI